MMISSTLLRLFLSNDEEDHNSTSRQKHPFVATCPSLFAVGAMDYSVLAHCPNPQSFLSIYPLIPIGLPRVLCFPHRFLIRDTSPTGIVWYEGGRHHPGSNCTIHDLILTQ